MKSYIFHVQLEPDEEGWRAFYPPLEEVGASTWGKSRAESLRNIQEVLSMIVEEFAEEDRPLPDTDDIDTIEDTVVAICA